ncbi:MAG: AHH domain-containing protein [Verrucomicrobiae bacterium]|nr:AHH domain-containing protein [Verrucomicrobiae bacterium]
MSLENQENPESDTLVLERHVSQKISSFAAPIYSYGNDLISQSQLLDDGQGGLVWVTSFYGYDGHGNTRYLTDAAGQLTDTYDYDAFGTLIAKTGSTPNSYLYCGEQFDPDLGLYFLRARYLNPDSGRFWTRDVWEGTIGNPASLHKYLYAHADPGNNADPSGLETLPSQSAASGIQAMLVRMGIQNVRVVVRKGVEVLVCVFGKKLLTDGQIHHIATDKNWKRGAKWSRSFDDMFREAGMSLDDIANKLVLPGHKGPHPEDYHQEVYAALKKAAEGAMSSASLEGLAADVAKELSQQLMEEAMQKALLQLASRLCNKTDPLTLKIVR